MKRSYLYALAALVGVAVLWFHPEAALWAPLVFGATLGDIAKLDTASVQSTFKRVYLRALDAVPSGTPLTAQLQKTTKFRAGPDGLHFNVKLETGGAVANVPDGRLLPRPTQLKRANGRADLAHTYTVVAIGGQGIALTQDNRSAFVSLLEDQLDDGMERVRNDVERQYNGDGRGILCKLSSVTGAPTYGVTDPYGIAGAGPGTMLLIDDMDVAVINPGTGAERGRAKVVSSDPAAGTVTLSAAVAGAAIGDYLVLCNDNSATGSDAVNNYLNESSGILAAAATGNTFEGISGATYRRWNAVVLDGAGADLTEGKLAEFAATLRAKSGKTEFLYYTSPGIVVKLGAQLATQVRREPGRKTLQAGYEAVEINGRTILEGVWCPKGHFFAIDTDADCVGWANLVEMGYVDLDGAKLHRVEGRHAYRADLWFPHQAIWFRRNAVGKITNLTDISSIVR
jgi:hypothetical protein